ncbi:MAG: PRC-barrel domain-containing protein [Pseudomonadota bacterium]
MKILYTSAAVLALTAGSALAQAGYTSKAADSVPGPGVSSSGEMPNSESGATADIGTTASDQAAEPEIDAGAGVDIAGDNEENVTLTDPEQQADAAPMDDADSDMALSEPVGSEEQLGAEQPIAPGMDTEEREMASGAVDQETQDIYAAPAPEIALEGWERLQLADITTEDLTGAAVFDANQEDIGTVSELFVGMNGELTEAELSVGGLIWGIGATDVRVSMDSLNIQLNLEAGDVRVFVDVTEDALIERAPE